MSGIDVLFFLLPLAGASQFPRQCMLCVSKSAYVVTRKAVLVPLPQMALINMTVAIS